MSVVRIRLAEWERNEEVVDVLMGLLERARLGEIHSIAGITLNNGSKTTHFICLDRRHVAREVVGELEMLKLKVHGRFVEE